MKILSIKGKNLASLDGEFCIDFENGALGRAGLFAITGPTGAGKSTILDALCVALFDKTPRLSDSGGALIGREGDDDRLGSNDVRSLLRRGAGSGYAEVAFIGRDGEGYLARWTVRKAREAANGRYQQQSLELRNLATGQGLGGTKTETLQRIKDLVGLTYEQFCRSVLLAQGDFAAFLKAGERERADLLERITGTQIYGNISKAAYRRMKDEEQLLAALERQKEEISLLDGDQRQENEEELGAVGLSLKAVVERLSAAEKAGEWYLRRKTLQEGVKDATLKKTEADTASESAADLRLELAAVEKAQPLRSLVTEADGAEQRVADARRVLEEQSKAKEAAEKRCAVSQTGVREAEIATANADQELANARPRLAEAIQLDTRIREAATQLEKSRREAEAAESSATKAREDLDLMLAQEKALGAQVSAASSWLADNGHLAPLAVEWNRWHHELQRYLKASLEYEKVSGIRGTLLDDEERARVRLEGAREVRTAAAAKEAAAKAALAEVEKSGAGIDQSALIRDRVAQEKQRDSLKSLQQLDRDLAVDLQEQRLTLATLQDSKNGASQAATEWQQAVREREKAEVALHEAERALLQAQAALNLEERRGELREGEPCPLCGSKEHPWAAGSPVHGLVQELEQRVAEVRDSKTALEITEAQGKEREATLLSQAAAMEARGKTFAQAIEEKKNGWEKLVQDLPENLRNDIAKAEKPNTGVAAALTDVEQKLGEILLLEEKAQQVAASIRSCRSAYDAALGERERAAEAEGVSEKSHRDVMEKLKLADLELGKTEKDMGQVLNLLSQPFSSLEGWETQLKQDAEGFIAQTAAEVEQWNSWTKKHEDGKTALVELKPGIEGVRVRLEGVNGDLQVKRAELQNHEQTLTGLRMERKELFEGRAVADVEAELSKKQSAAQAGLKAAREEDVKRKAEHAAASAALEQTGENLRQLAEASQVARSAFEREMARVGVEEQDLRRQLSHDHGWITAQRDFLAKLDQAAHAAHTVLGERQKALAQHEQSGQPVLDEVEVQTAKDSADAEKKNLEQRQFEIRHRLEVDDDAKKKSAELVPLIAAQLNKTNLWRSISEVIGSADGKKFRSYAQSLTLEVLLGYANEHLRSLAPRYAVVRVPSSEMELQMVDRDMGDEVRSVNSLSGGESFLVSLALALGLSSLSSHTTQVESLFIDEGFGSLDPDTLEVALATLDSLQASGRKVGIISHVPGLAERIGARIEVIPGGGGRSRVRVAAL